MIDLKDKSVIVTGAGRGIGKSIAIALAEKGANLVLASRTKSELELTAQEIKKYGGNVITVQTDLTDENQIQKMVDGSIKKFGKIDILVNNAGIGYFSNVVDMRTQDFDEMFAVNMRGLFLTTRAVLPGMTNQNSGDIVNISSLAGRNAFVGGAGYAATKWAVIGFSRCLMLEVRQYNIRVITICPGSVLTKFSSREKDPAKIPKAEDIATVVVDALSMPRNVMVSEIDVRPTNP